MEARRSFLKKVGVGATALCCGGVTSILLSACSSVNVVAIKPEQNELKIGKKAFAEHDIVVVNVEGFEAPIYVAKVGVGYNAMYMMCTHNECVLKPTGKFLTCPCHGSEFSNNGTVLKSPAEKPLKSFATAIQGDFVIVKLNN